MEQGVEELLVGYGWEMGIPLNVWIAIYGMCK